MMKIQRFLQLSLVLALVLLGACQDPSRDKPQATTEPVSEPAATQPAAAKAPAAPGHSLKLGPHNASIGFVGSKVTGSHVGSFPSFGGLIALGEDGVTGAHVAIEIDMNSVETDNEKLTGHLKSKDFFEVETYPTASFESTAITAGGEGSATHTITGELELHGVRKQITFPANIELTPEAVKATAEFSINRKDFEINYPGRADDLIRDGVVLKLDINVPRG